MAAAEEAFMEAVEEGLKLSKRLYFGKDRSVAPPKPPPPMSKNPRFYLPTAPMVYAVITDPGIVDNPDIPSYQPYVYGRCDPSALIPLQMNNVSLEVDCYLDTVFVRVSGQWRVHCVMGSKVCDCRLAVPMGEQGSILGVEIDVPRKSYHTQLVSREEAKDEKASGEDDGGFLRPDIFFLTIPQVDGGSNISITISWSQKLLYHDGEFSLSVPFCFPEYVNPASKKIPRKEKIQLKVHPGDETEVLCKTISHPLKERKRQVECLSFLYESDVLSWSNTDFSFSYSVPTSRVSGSVYLQSPSIDDTDQREMFCVHLLPGTQQEKKFSARNIVYIVDTSSSMQGRPLDATRKTLCAALCELTPEDMFNIISFNAATFTFSSSMKHANPETIEKAIRWMDDTLLVQDGTEISLALDKAMEMLSDTHKSLPMIFLITDGAVEDERRICEVAKSRLSNTKAISPRIHTFGIGLYCNHYFLRMLAMIGRGHYEAAYNADSIESRLKNLITTASSTVLTNITFDTLDELDNAEVHPINVPDLSSESPLTISGRCSGKFPEVFKARGILADMTSCELDLKVYKSKAIPLDKILPLQQITVCTSEAWFLGDKQLETKHTKMATESNHSEIHALQSICYKRGSLQLLDQRKLPLETVYLDIQNASDGWFAIKEMVVRGAPAIAIAAALSLAVEAVNLKTFEGTADDAASFLAQKLEYLVSSRPTAVNLSDASTKLKEIIFKAASTSLEANAVFQAYIEAAEIMLEDDVASNKEIGSYGARCFESQLKDAKKISILTHCNTGSLATAGYGTALGVIRAVHAQGILEKAYCTETRPFNQGSRLTAFELVHDNIPATLIADSAAAALMKVGRVQGVIVGADRVAGNGDTANKIGTYSLAVSAKHHGIPFYVAAPLTSVDLSLPSGESIVIEERSPKELLNSRGGLGEQVAASGISVWNPAFDVTPANLISGIITEKGVITKSKDEDFDIKSFVQKVAA